MRSDHQWLNPVSFLCSAITKVSCFNSTPVQSDCVDNLRVTGNKINRLVTPLDIIAVNIEDDPFNGLLRRKFNDITVNFDIQTSLFDTWEVSELEWFRPKIPGTKSILAGTKETR